MVGVSLTTGVTATQETADGVDTLGVVGAGVVETLVDLLLALDLRVPEEVGRTRTLRLAVHDATASVGATGALQTRVLALPVDAGLFSVTVRVLETVVLLTAFLRIPVEAAEAEAQWTVVGDAAAGVGATGVVVARVLTLTVDAALGQQTVGVGATTSGADATTTQETLRAVVVFATLGVTVVVAARLATVAAVGGAASLEAEATFARPPEATVAVGGALTHGRRTGLQRVAHSVGGAATLRLVVHHLTLGARAADGASLARIAAPLVDARLIRRTGGV